MNNMNLLPFTHDFHTSLAMSHRASDWPGWEPLYREFFPTFAGMCDHRQDGDHQRLGIDRSITLANAKIILVDEKVRGRNNNGNVYEDILLEVMSDKDRRTPGWVRKPLQADYIAYLIAPLGICHLLPVLQLQLAWERHGDKWTHENGTREARNTRWTTVNVPVDVNVLYQAIGNGLHRSFTSWEVGTPEPTTGNRRTEHDPHP